MAYKYNEIFRLRKMLTENKIPFQMRQKFDGWQIGYPDLPPITERDVDGRCTYSIVEHFGSYGHEQDLLEIYKGKGNPDGNLTAEECFGRILAHKKGCEMKQ